MALSDFVLDYLKEKRESKRERSRLIYRPILEQFNGALGEIGNGERPNSLNRAFWEDLKRSGRVDAIKPSLKTRLADIYENLAPRYDSAWITANGQELANLMGELGRRFGTARAFRPGATLPKWYRFLSHETFSRSVLELANPNDVQLWDRNFLDFEKIRSQNVDQFLRGLWEDADRLIPFRTLKETRTKLRSEMSGTIRDLKNNIVN